MSDDIQLIEHGKHGVWTVDMRFRMLKMKHARTEAEESAVSEPVAFGRLVRAYLMEEEGRKRRNLRPDQDAAMQSAGCYLRL